MFAKKEKWCFIELRKNLSSFFILLNYSDMSPEERMQQAISILNEHYRDIIKDVKFSWTLNFTKELRVAFTFSNGVQKNLCFSSIWYDSDRLEDLVGLKHLSFQGWESEDIKIITKFVHYLTYLAKEDGAL